MALKYVGSGSLPNVPARDLNDEEVARFGGEAMLLQSGLYVQKMVVRPARSDKMLRPQALDKNVEEGE